MPYRLKSIELNGYKTFATRTVFEFSETITAVVGPNGSGKSNIADGLRWVLGEQSYSLLRGRKTDDMIFAGSDSRPQAGMASVTLIFDNSDGWLPIDFSEVSITRRAYRDGQNEYLINNEKVRLRDVTELLSQSGLAERTYTVIGQGLVDAALSLNSSERRRLFEEAAGIGLYRNRKDQSIRRLDKTRRNLERVEDILAELKPRLRGLKNQSQRAKDFDQIRDDLQEVLREWYGFHWHRTQRRLKDAKGLAGVQDEKMQKARNSQEQKSIQLGESRENISKLRAHLSGWNKNLVDLRAQWELVHRDMAVARERERFLTERDASIASEQGRIELDVNLYQERVNETTSEVEKVAQELTEAENKSLTVSDALEERVVKREAIQAEILNLQDLLAATTASRLKLEARRISLESRVGGYLNKQLDYKASEANAKEETDSAQSSLDASSKVVRNLEAENEDIKNSLSGRNAKIEEIRQELQDTLEARTKIESEIARLEARREVIDQAERNFTGYAKGVQMLLAAASDKKISAKQGALNKQLKIPADLEIAIAAAIGEYSDAFLLDEMSESDTALDLLQDNGGRAALLPLDGLTPVQPLKRPNHKDCLGVASAMVDAPSKLQPAVDLLLGQVLVVRNRRAARDILKDQPEQVRAVTLSGELFYKTGQIFVDAKGGTGILSRPRKQKELKNDIEIEAAKLKEISVKIDIFEQQISEQINEKSEIEKNNLIAAKKLNEAQKVSQECYVELAQASRIQEWQRGQLKDSELEHKNTLKEMQSSGEERVSIDEEIMRLEKELGAENLSLSNLPLEELKEQVRQWNTQIAFRQKSLQEGRLREQESQLALTKIVEQKKELETQKQSLLTQRADLQDKKRHSSGSDEELTGQISALEVQVLPAEEELGALESDHDGLIAGEQLARDALSAAERQNSQAQIGYSRQQEALETLQRRIEDDFGLVEFEYDDSVSGPTPLPLGDLVEHLPIVTELSPEIEDSLKRQRAQLRRIGSINPEAQKEYEQVQERYDFLTDQVEDLTSAEEDMREVIAELEGMMDREFRKTFDSVAREFRGIFSRLFGGGSARLILTDAENFSDAGVEIEARLPGKRPQRLALLSGGERSLTATALVFALLKASPTPFCVMDEVDAMLDEANVERFTELLSEFSQETQFILITHNRNTVQAADVIYGVTMGRDTASQIISLKLDDVDERYAVEAA